MVEDLGRSLAALGVVAPGKVPPPLVGAALGKEVGAGGETLPDEPFWLPPARHGLDSGRGVGGGRGQEAVLPDAGRDAAREAPLAFGFVWSSQLATVVGRPDGVPQGEATAATAPEGQEGSLPAQTVSAAAAWSWIGGVPELAGGEPPRPHPYSAASPGVGQNLPALAL